MHITYHGKRAKTDWAATCSLIGLNPRAIIDHLSGVSRALSANVKRAFLCGKMSG